MLHLKCMDYEISHQSTMLPESNQLVKHVWNKGVEAVASEKSRPKSLDVSRKSGPLWLRKFEKIHNSFKVQYGLSMVQTSSKSCVGKKPDVHHIGYFARPLTWGPNGSKFTTAIRFFYDFDTITSSEKISVCLLDDVTNNNIRLPKLSPMSNQLESDAETSSCEKSPSIIDVRSGIKQTTSENLDAKIVSANDSQNTPQLAHDVISAYVRPSDRASSSLTALAVETESDVEKLVSELINQVVRKEATRKIQSVFNANEKQLELNFQSKKEKDIVRAVVNEMIENVIKKELQNLSITHGFDEDLRQKTMIIENCFPTNIFVVKSQSAISCRDSDKLSKKKEAIQSPAEHWIRRNETVLTSQLKKTSLLKKVDETFMVKTDLCNEPCSRATNLLCTNKSETSSQATSDDESPLEKNLQHQEVVEWSATQENKMCFNLNNRLEDDCSTSSSANVFNEAAFTNEIKNCVIQLVDDLLNEAEKRLIVAQKPIDIDDNNVERKKQFLIRDINHCKNDSTFHHDINKEKMSEIVSNVEAQTGKSIYGTTDVVQFQEYFNYCDKDNQNLRDELEGNRDQENLIAEKNQNKEDCNTPDNSRTSDSLETENFHNSGQATDFKKRFISEQSSSGKQTEIVPIVVTSNSSHTNSSEMDSNVQKNNTNPLQDATLSLDSLPASLKQKNNNTSFSDEENINSNFSMKTNVPLGSPFHTDDKHNTTSVEAVNFDFSRRRPSQLQSRNTKVFRLLQNFSSSDIAQRDKNADVYSEATEKVLEENKLLRRQESFTKPLNRNRPIVKKRQVKRFDDLKEEESDKVSLEDKSDKRRCNLNPDPNNTVSDTELLAHSSATEGSTITPSCECCEKNQFPPPPTRSNSLPFSLQIDINDIIKFSPVEIQFDENLRPEAKSVTPTTAIPHYLAGFVGPDDDRNRRDSAQSRESAASSGTMVPSDNEDLEFPVENKETTPHSKSLSKSIPSAPSPLTQSQLSGGAVLRRTLQIERSQSLDRNQRNSRRLTPYISQSSVNHRTKCGMMLSAPSITVSHDYKDDIHPSMTNFNPVMSSTQSLTSSTSYMGDESDTLRSGSIGSSPQSSPSESPQMERKSHKSKLLKHRNTKQAERQAAEACDWLKAAGFPQYVQLFEDGHFPVDIASASSDHDFLGQEDIAALVRRLNILNKCANLKLDKITSKEAQADNDDEELEQYALSDFWRIEDGHRWSRLNSKASSITSPTARLSLAGRKSLSDTLHDDSNGDVFSTDEVSRTSGSEHSPHRNRRSSQSQTFAEQRQANLKPKSQSFLKRVGGDLKKFGSFKRKDHQRPVILPISFEDEPPKAISRNRYKSLRKNRKVEIGDPILQGGHEKLEQLKCTPIDGAVPTTKEPHLPQRVRKGSSHSLVSSSSSGGASGVSTPASRRTRASMEDFISDFGDVSPNLLNRQRNLLFDLQHSHNSSSSKSKENVPDKDSSMFVIPPNYKPGTFPAALREKVDSDVAQPPTTVPARSSSISETSSAPLVAVTSESYRKSSRPMSIYDNLPNSGSGGSASALNLVNLWDPGMRNDDLATHRGSIDSLEVSGSGIDPAFWSVDDIVEHAQSLQQMVGSWGDGDDDDDENNDDQPNKKKLESILAETVNFPIPSENLPSYNAENISNIDDDSDTLSRTSADLRNQVLLRWEPIRRDDTDSTPASDNLQLHNLSASQLMMLRRLAVLKLTARMEQYALTNNKGSLSWSMPRFIRRIKEPDYKDKTVFGVPLLQNVHRFGQPLPLCMQFALAHLRRTALDQIGLFRKPGVRGRIHKLRALCELNPEMEVFEGCTDYDIADLIKQYFRELPDPLMTMKMSDTFVGIFLHVPENLRLQTLQAAVMLLPDENRETLKTLLHFLADVASKFDENQMNASNLSTCFAPSLFYQQLGNLRFTASTTPKSKKLQSGKPMMAGRPDLRAMNENKASNECLAFMIAHVSDLFKISEDAIAQCRMSVMQQSEDVLATEIGFKSDYQHEKDYYSDFHSYVDRAIRETLREEQRFHQNRSWQTVPSAPGCELAYKKMNDGIPLRLWRSKVEISGADPIQIMDRILNERHVWDEELLQWKVVQQPDERTQLFQIVRSEMSPHPSRDYCVLRSYRNNVKPRDCAFIVEVSTSHPSLLGDVRGVVLMSRYVIEPTDVPNKCYLKHFCRVDTKGRNPEWYKAYGYIVLRDLLRIRDSLKLVPPKTLLNAS